MRIGKTSDYFTNVQLYYQQPSELRLKAFNIPMMYIQSQLIHWINCRLFDCEWLYFSDLW